MTELQPGRIYLPENPNKAEFDILMIEKPATSENQYLREVYEVEYTLWNGAESVPKKSLIGCEKLSSTTLFGVMTLSTVDFAVHLEE